MLAGAASFVGGVLSRDRLFGALAIGEVAPGHLACLVGLAVAIVRVRRFRCFQGHGARLPSINRTQPRGARFSSIGRSISRRVQRALPRGLIAPGGVNIALLGGVSGGPGSRVAIWSRPV